MAYSQKIIAVLIDLHMIEDDISKVKETMMGYNTLGYGFR
jgi:hypothetical protein